MLLSLLQVGGGNPTFPKAKRSDGLQPFEIQMGYHADWPRDELKAEKYGKKTKKG
jgi:hypothetical protein